MRYATFFSNMKTITSNFPYKDVRSGFPVFVVKKKGEGEEFALEEIIDGSESAGIKTIVVYPDEFLLVEEEGDGEYIPKWAKELKKGSDFKTVVFVEPEKYLSHEKEAFKEFLAKGSVEGEKVLPSEGAVAVAVSSKDIYGLIKRLGLTSIHLKRVWEIDD